jgi:hypothetical protein
VSCVATGGYVDVSRVVYNVASRISHANVPTVMRARQRRVPQMAKHSLWNTRNVQRSVVGRATVALGLVIAIGWASTSHASADATVAPSVATAVNGNTFRMGVTDTQYSLDSPINSVAASRAAAVLTSSASLQNQYTMGYGADNPEPSPGVYNWASLDARVKTIYATTGTASAVLTLAGAPDWMKGGVAGQTDWSNLDVAPTPAHYQDFANLAAAVARRYPAVHYFQVWSELKGFWNTGANRWDYEDYTALYNKVYVALKAVNPAIQVGGPYMPMDSWSSPKVASNPSSISGPWGVLDQRNIDAVNYWLAHKVGADFVSVDGWTQTKDKGVITTPTLALEKFAAVDAWLRSRTTLPIWWSEFYVSATDSTAGNTSTALASLTEQALSTLKTSGAAVALEWQPQAGGDAPTASVWTDPLSSSGGQALPLSTYMASAGARTVPAGTSAVAASTPAAGSAPSLAVARAVAAVPAIASVAAPHFAVAPAMTHLLASDDFAGTALNGRWGVYNTSYTSTPLSRVPSLVKVSGGLLDVTTTGAAGSGLCWCRTKPSQPYGRWEVRARMPSTAGHGPAILLWPNDGVWPLHGEIDMLEMPHTTPTTAKMTVHYAPTNRQVTRAVPIDFTKWHVYDVEWAPSYIRYWIDGVLVFTITDKAIIPRSPMFLAIEAGADVAHPPNVSGTLQVDWVREYGS